MNTLCIVKGCPHTCHETASLCWTHCINLTEAEHYEARLAYDAANGGDVKPRRNLVDIDTCTAPNCRRFKDDNKPFCDMHTRKALRMSGVEAGAKRTTWTIEGQHLEAALRVACVPGLHHLNGKVMVFDVWLVLGKPVYSLQLTQHQVERILTAGVLMRRIVG